ncbi:PEP-CTERM sorting domain-containing protein [Pseudoduganella sp. FT93W]|uniref:PEP-CTERM sorting domain-containing protein n=1 Tax=Duganella fentianensis TaxID=2692177 RepID=A0A845HYR0_9BURK|nr:PEP-CTERM sorting domain-containing protein [Duganella fentianensis]MYN44036.1 PEP-CTERM sorting domain-containing protein [Duganella fentianensis]
MPPRMHRAHTSRRARPLVAALMAAGLILPQAPSSAADVVWTGSAINCIQWNCAGNWGNDLLPAKRDNLVFGKSAVSASDNDLLQEIGHLTFASDAPAMTLSGKTVDSQADIRNFSAYRQTINMPLKFSSPGYYQPGNSQIDGGKAGLKLADVTLDTRSLKISNDVSISNLKAREYSLNNIYIAPNSTLTTNFVNNSGGTFNGNGWFSLAVDGPGATLNNNSALLFGGRSTSISLTNGAVFNDIGAIGTNYIDSRMAASTIRGPETNFSIAGAGTKWLSQRDLIFAVGYTTNRNDFEVSNGAYMSTGNFIYDNNFVGSMAVTGGMLDVQGDFKLSTGSAMLQYGTIQVKGTASFGQNSLFIFNEGTLSAAQFDNAGRFTWQGGTLGFTGSGGAQLGTSILPKDLLIDGSKGLQVSNTLTISDGTSLTVTNGQLQSGLLAVRGGTANLSEQAAASNGVQLSSGTLVVSGTGSISVSKLLRNTPVLDTGKTLQLAGTLSLEAGSSLTVDGGQLSARYLQLDGGTLNIMDDSTVSGKVALNSGTLRLTSKGSVALGTGLFEQSVRLGQNATLEVSKGLNIGTGTNLTFAGGQLRAGSLNLSGGTLRFDNEVGTQNYNWTSGTLSLGGRNGATLGSGALAQNTLVLNSARNLNVDHTLSLGRNTNLVLDGGQFKAGTLALQGGRVSGQLNIDKVGLLQGYGSVNGAISGGSSARINASGGVLSLGDGNDAAGFGFAGTLDVGNSRVWIFNQGVAQLGSATFISDKGQLHSSDGLLLGAGNTLSSSGNTSIYGLFVNQGSVSSSGGTLSFYDDVSGTGSFTGQMLFRAGYNPGGAGASAQVGFGGGSASYDSNAILTMEVMGSGHDQMSGLSTLNFNGTLHLVFGADFNANPGSSIKLFDFQHFSGQLDAEHIVVDGYDRAKLDFSHLGRDGSISVSAVPEPSSYAMLLGGLGLLAWRRRRTLGVRQTATGCPNGKN